MAKTTHALSTEGRARCAETGAANLRRWKENAGDQRAEITMAVEKFREELVAELGGEAKLSAAAAAGVVSATVLYHSILSTQRVLLGDLPRRARMQALQAQLPVTTNSFLRTLRSLGVDLRGAGDDEAAAADVDDLLSRYGGKRKEASENVIADDAR